VSPKHVDHEQRRSHITDALARITIKGGLDRVSFREVAEEAGVSVRLVQYYFGTKDELLLAAWRHLGARVTRRIFAAIAAAGENASPRAVIQIVINEFLPVDAERSDAALLFIAFHTASLTDPSLARAEAREMPRQLANFVATKLEEAREAGDLAGDIDPVHESVAFVTEIIGLGHMILSGTYSVEEGVGIASYTVDRLFQR
jgi:AcrR family transcriptional regulator